MKTKGESWDRLVNEFADVGRILFEAGLNNSHSGNMSVRLGDKVVITRRGSMLAALKPDDLVVVGLSTDDSGIALASTEVNVHRAIYTTTSALAVVHTHPRSATALSFAMDSIVPVDVEGRYYFKRIPVLEVKKSIGSEELEGELPRLLKDFPVVMVKGHGAFAVGGNLEEGLQITHAMEWSCDIYLRALSLGLSPENLIGEDTHGDW
jgi:L-fuculose-phosphate aldolase